MNETKALVLVAHGSRRNASNDEVRELAERLRDKAQAEFAQVCCAFLELAEPSIPQGIEDCIKGGAEHVVVVPYFLSAGRHVSEDIPQMVQQVRDKYPDCRVEIAPYLGTDEGMSHTLYRLAAECLM